MASKLQYYYAVAEQTAKEIAANRGNWTNFLDTAAKLYKYPFPDQLMIYAQKPDATICAEMALWNNKDEKKKHKNLDGIAWKRLVRIGAKGIALIDDSGEYPRLKHVFDISDTISLLSKDIKPFVWEMRQEHRAPVLIHFAGIYDDLDDTLAESFHSIAEQLAREYYIDNAREIRYRAEDSFMEDFDEDNLGVVFQNMLSASIEYTLMSRCGFDTPDYFEDDDFQYIFNFNTPDIVYALGTATSELSEQVLRDIEMVIKKYERQHTAERSEQNYDQNLNLHTERGLSTAGYTVIRTAEGVDGAVGQIRENAESVSERLSDNDVQHNVTERDVVPPFTGNGGSGEHENDASNEHTNNDKSVTRQNDRSDGLDGDDEYPESTSGGNGIEQPDLHLNNSGTYSQVGNSLIETLSTPSIKLDEVDTILRDGGNDNASHLRITAYFSKKKTLEDNANFLWREYLMGRYRHRAEPGGKGYKFGIQQTSVWFDDTGIRIGRGKSAIYSTDYAQITWEQAAVRVKELFDAGQYVSHDFLDEAIDNEKIELADKLWNFYRDDMKHIPKEWRSEHGGYPGDVEIIKGLLDDSDERQAILDHLESDVTEWRNTSDHRSWHNPERLLSDMRDSMIPPNGFPAADFQSTGYMSFITDDEVDSYFTQGSNVSEGKYRILSHFLHEHTPKERIDFLKHEYGHGGGTWIGHDGSHEAEPGKGITLKRSGCENVNFNWNRAVQKIDELIKSGKYMSRTELNRLPEYERLILARQIQNFYYDLPEGYLCPFPKDMDFHYPHEEEWTALNNFLDDTEHMEAVLGEMQYIYTNTPEEDRYYNTRNTGFINLSNYYEGTYTLFPGLENQTGSVQTVSPKPKIGDQLDLFADELLPELPSVQEQRETIEQELRQETNNAGLPFLNISDEDKERIIKQFADNPRSRETVNLVRKIYGDSLNMPLPQAIRRIAELANEGRFVIIEQKSITENDIVTDESNLTSVGMNRFGELFYSDGKPLSETEAEKFRESKDSEPAERFVVAELPNRVGVYAVWDNENKRFYEDENNNISTFTERAEVESYRDTLAGAEKIVDAINTIEVSETEKRTHIYEYYQQAQALSPPDSVILLSVGGFFELYGKDADIAEEHLGLTAAYRESPFPERIKMCGFPDWVLVSNITKLTNEGYIVAEARIDDTGTLSIRIHSPKEAEIAEPVTNILYNIGDRLEYNGKLHEIDRIGDFIRVKNLGTPSAYPVFDYISFRRSDFERMLSNGELAVRPPETETANEPDEIDTATVYYTPKYNIPYRKGDIIEALNTSSENPVKMIIEKIDENYVYYDFVDDPDLNSEPVDIFRDDFENYLDNGGFKSTAKDALQITENIIEEPVTELTELDFDTVAQNILERAMQNATFTDAVANAQVRGALRNPVTKVLDSVFMEIVKNGELPLYKSYFAEDDLNDRLFDYIYRQSWENKQKQETIVTEQAVSEDEIIPEINEEQIINENIKARSIPESPKNPPPVFFVDWDEVQYDFDLNLYNDHDIIGYNQNGVEYALGRSGGLNYVTGTGMLWGDNTVPGDIYKQIEAYKNGELTDEQVRANYLNVLETFRNYKAADIIEANQDLLDVLDNGLFSQAEKETTLSMFEKGATNNDIAMLLSESYNGTVDTMTFINGEIADYSATFDGLLIDIKDKFDTTLSFTWVEITPVVRALAWQWLEKQEAEKDIPAVIVSQSDIKSNDDFQSEQEKADVWYRVGDKVYFNNSEFEITQISDIGTVKTRDIDSKLHWYSPEMFEALINTNDRNRQLRSSRINTMQPQNEQFSLFDLSEDSAPVATKVETQTTLPQSTAVNFRIADDHLGEGGAKIKFKYNFDAINTLKNIELEKRTATPEEQLILSRYVGWGGLPQAFDLDNTQWKNEYLELKATISPEEYESARASTLNAHYTAPTVIKAIYETVGQMGFKSGNILEPACGIGNFFGLTPESMKSSKLYGVELDSITARIAKQLYPKANIKETGYEKIDTPDAFFDLAIGNVPFGSYGVVDKRYDKHKFLIHDYFFAKTLDQVRPGGIIAFITSKGTLDKQNPEVRKYIAQRAELLGAVRLPNNAFLKNAGTEVTSDIIFLQKRDRPIDIEPDWVHLGYTANGIPINRYFIDNPEMILGTMAFDERMYGKETTCNPIENADLAEQLKTALFNVQGQYTVDELDDIEGIDDHAIPADPTVKNFSYTTSNGMVYFRENSLMYPVDLPATTLERIKGMIYLRNCVHELISLQLDEHSEAEIKAKQAELSQRYDHFIFEYGLINSQANSRAFNADSAYYLLCSLEIIDEDGNLERKADMFTKRTIKQKIDITRVDTASEALAVSLGEHAFVDLEYMESLTGFSQEKLISDLDGVIFLNIGNADSQQKTYITANEYLSGNVRKKLEEARAAQAAVGDGSFDINVRALEAAQPKDLDASEISVRLGSTWIEPEYVQEFMHELLKTTWRMRQVYEVKYHQFSGEWQVTGKKRAQYSDILANVTYGTERMNAYQIIDDTLNLRDVRVYDYVKDADGNEKRVLNKKETTLAQQKQEQIKQAFKDWIWKDPERRQKLVKEYNEKFNSVRPREYDGTHITFSGISPEITLRPHQLNAIAHIMYGGNTLLAHEVGAGKTFEMVGAAMESKRLGLCNKSLFAVPNHLTEQWAGEFLRLYPSANILVATKKDFEMRNRKKFCAKIATGDYDAVIIGHSQLEKIPLSRERQERLLNEQLEEIEEGISELQASQGERFSIKQLEKTKKSIETRLTKLLEAKKRDDVVTFEQLGVDRLFVDEAHGFKNLFLVTKMRNVAGLSATEAQKSSDLFMKCRYMDELTDNKGVIFATGTPISNSMTEMYTMQRYLQYDTLVAKNLTHFDCWASIFGETQTSIELAPEGTGYRARTRFAKFHNLPELMCIFKEVADIQTADMLNLPVPKALYENIIVEPSELQKEMVVELSERASAVHAHVVDARVDNMLKITTDGRKIGLDQRLMNPLLPDFDGSKVNACTENVYRIWDETKADRLTQLVFCDFSTPNKDGRFNVYDDMKAKLLNNGVPEHEIAFIHDADTETRKKELFAKVRQGKVRILFGSTFKMGSGTNVQDRLVAIHDADCPWRPADLEQRAGRIVRQGNKNAEVQIFRYATSGTFDSYLWQTVESKQKFIAQIMSSKSPVRSCEDVDETALSYAEIKALCAGNPLIAEKMNLDVEVAKLRMLKADHQSQHYRLEDELLKRYPEQITAATERIAGIEKDIAMYAEQNEKSTAIQESISGNTATVTAKFPGMTVNGVEYKEKEPAAKALLESCKGVTDKKELTIGKYMGFDMSLQFDSFNRVINIMLRGTMTYQTDLGTDAHGNITRINNVLNELPKRLDGAKSQLTNLYSQQEAAKLELEKPFALADELAEKEARLALLNADLNIDGNGGFDVMNDADNREDDNPEKIETEIDDEDEDEYIPQAVSAKSVKPSFLDDIRSFNSNKNQSIPNGKISDRNI